MDYAAIAAQIIEQVGGKDNMLICATKMPSLTSKVSKAFS